LRHHRLIRLEVFLSLARRKIGEADFSVGGFLRFEDRRQLVDPRIGNLDDAQVNLFFAAKTAVWACRPVSMLKSSSSPRPDGRSIPLSSWYILLTQQLRDKQSSRKHRANKSLARARMAGLP
jgi:hypothetical protein